MMQTELFTQGGYKINRSDKSFIYLLASTHWMISEELAENDLLRIGGVRSLRGFPENFFYVKNYAIFKGEHHWMFADESSFFVLADGGYIGHVNINYAYGLGIGFDLKVNNGIFELVYAVGGYEEMSISFDRSIIHFGYRAVF